MLKKRKKKTKKRITDFGKYMRVISENRKFKKQILELNDLIDRHKTLNLFKAKKLFEYREKLALIGKLLGIELTSADPSKLDLFIIKTEGAVRNLTKAIRTFQGNEEEDKDG